MITRPASAQPTAIGTTLERLDRASASHFLAAGRGEGMAQLTPHLPRTTEKALHPLRLTLVKSAISLVLLEREGLHLPVSGHHSDIEGLFSAGLQGHLVAAHGVAAVVLVEANILE